MKIEDAYWLAEVIQWIHAKELALESRRYKKDPYHYYDKHAMVELAELIYRVATEGRRRKR